MPISAATIAAYAPWGNAQLAFKVTSGVGTGREPGTGNPVILSETLEYLAALQIGSPEWEKAEGVDQTLYACQGRLLEPAVLDPRITNGSQAEAFINGLHGRLEVVFDLAMDEMGYSTVRQTLQGKFRVVGGGRHAP
jgi:hypothetical protein